MLCINSAKEGTRVVNSRAHKKLPIVWRRRQGTISKTTFTTYERPSLADHTVVTADDPSGNEFNLGKLIISIAAAFAHNPHAAQYDTLYLAYTIEAKLAMQDNDQLTAEVIAKTTHATLKRFDELAAIQYAAQHRLITSIRRRGRSSIHETT